MSHLTLVYSAPAGMPPPPPEPAAPTWHEPREQRLTGKDLIALTCWTQRSDAHGYRRVLIESGAGDEAPEDGGYALVYAPGHDWASWGLARTDGGVTVWHCGSGSDLGRHSTMLEALDSLPPAASHQQSTQRPVAAARHASPCGAKLRLAWAGHGAEEASA
jgi:hypothetical protein